MREVGLRRATKTKLLKAKRKAKPKNKVGTNNCYSVAERNSVIPSSHLSIPLPFFQPLIYVSIYLSISIIFNTLFLSLTHSHYQFLSLHRHNTTHKERRNMETPRIHPTIKTKESTPSNPTPLSVFLSHQWPSWTKIYVEERKTKNKEWETKERS